MEGAPAAIQEQISEKNLVLRQNLQARMQSLTYRQQLILMNIRRFPSDSRTAVAEHMKKAAGMIPHRRK